MMLAVMQPYLFPYLGYYQLAYHVNKFIFYDDVNFIKGGYINRNNILANGRRQLFTIPVEKSSSNRKINELHFSNNRKKVVKTIEQSYRRAPYFEAVIPIVCEILNSSETHVPKLCSDSVGSVFKYLGLEFNSSFSSDLHYNRDASAKDKLYSICKILKADKYCNMKNGQSQYSKDEFAEKGIELSFLEMENFSYYQGKNDFVSHLSIIDILMWNDKSAVKALMKKYIIS